MVDYVVLTWVCPRSLDLVKIVRMNSLDFYVIDFRSFGNGGPQIQRDVVMAWAKTRCVVGDTSGEKYDGCSPLPRETPWPQRFCTNGVSNS